MAETIRTVRSLAVVAALGAGLVYVLIGAGVLSIGTAADGSVPDLLAFGLLVGGVHGAVALLLVRVQSRALWVVVGGIEVLVLVGYVAMGSLREPPFEPWGILIKAFQLIVLGCVAYLVLHAREAIAEDGIA